MKTICVINQKGGVAKTTSAINISSYLNRIGKKVLIIDANEQSNLSETFIKDDIKPNSTLFSMITKNEFTGVTTLKKGLDIIPTTSDITGLEHYLSTDKIAKLTPANILKNRIEQFNDKYDYCIVDCPAQTALITVNILNASDYVIIPVKTSIFAWDGLKACIDFIIEIKENLNPKLVLLGIFLTFYSQNYTSSKESLKILSENGYEDYLLKTKIRQSQDIVNIEKKGSIFDFKPKSSSAEDYENLTKELLQRIKKLNKNKLL